MNGQRAKSQEAREAAINEWCILQAIRAACGLAAPLQQRLWDLCATYHLPLTAYRLSRS